VEECDCFWGAHGGEVFCCLSEATEGVNGGGGQGGGAGDCCEQRVRGEV
jgi:hypothetical protein